VRDRATCGFSGTSLWLLDYGIRPNWQMDWVDHIKPHSRGGTTAEENGICASHTFNSKKRSNGADNVFFFRDGRITSNYLWTFGSPSSEVVERLKRLEKLHVSDWYFNRCIANTFIGFNWRYDSEFDDVKAVRTDEYWFGAAWKRWQIYARLRSPETIQERGLINPSRPFGTDLLMKLENLSSNEEYRSWAEKIYPVYRLNLQVLSEFTEANGDPGKQRFIAAKAAKKRNIHPEILISVSLPEDVLHRSE
jgi:hypothetical protein